uniref:Uncharacterized protein n=1 Tax=Trichobilharzia regenti TaxID=157069 RepID=A0AA85JSB5_TRIRE|nr:unnamed protein product [Trichobilharzia regenti]
MVDVLRELTSHTNQQNHFTQLTLCQPKDSTTKEDKANIIYKIDCNNCEKYDIGQSGHPLRLRIHDHKLAVKRHDIHSLVSPQCIQTITDNVQNIKQRKHQEC